jgi:hypothetical protein
MIVTLVFVKNAIFFRRKLAKIAENRDHNIDPRCHARFDKNGTFANEAFAYLNC